MSLGDILRELLFEKDMTQKQLAKSLCIGASTLGNYVQDNREPDYETLKAIADFFDVTTDYLLGHRTKCHSISCKEHELLRIYRALSADQQELFLKQGRLFIIHFK